MRPSRALLLAGVVLTGVAIPVSTLAAPRCFGKLATVTRSPDNPYLVGTSGRDVIVGGPGRDVIRGEGGGT